MLNRCSEHSRVLDMFYILIDDGYAEHTFVKNHQIVDFKCAHLIVYKLHLK